MSRIGKNPIQIPEKVEIAISDSSSGSSGQTVKVKGPKGELESAFRKEIKITKEENKIVLKRDSDEKLNKSLHGMTRSLIQNMILGVTQGYKKE